MSGTFTMPVAVAGATPPPPPGTYIVQFTPPPIMPFQQPTGMVVNWSTPTENPMALMALGAAAVLGAVIGFTFGKRKRGA